MTKMEIVDNCYQITDESSEKKHNSRILLRCAEADMPTSFGTFRAIAYEERNGRGSTREHVALIKGDPALAQEPILVRVHSKCVTSEAFHSVRCDCRRQLEAALARIAAAGLGIVIYLDQEGRGIGLVNKIRAYQLQDTGKYDTVSANTHLGYAPDLRDYRMAIEILKDLRVSNIALLTNNPAKVESLSDSEINVTRVPLDVRVPRQAQRYMKTKVEKMGHWPVNGYRSQE